MTKKLTLTLLTISLIMAWLIPVLAFASAPTLNSLLTDAATQAGYQTDDEVGQTGLASLIGAVVRAFLALIGIIFICYTIYGGYLWLTAAGNDEKVTKAKDTIRDGVIGLIIILAAAGIYAFIYTFILAGGSSTL